MSGRASRNDEDRIDPQVIAGLHVPRREALRRNGHAAKSPGVERHGRSAFGRSRLYFDEGEDLASPCDDIDLAAGNTGAPGEDAPAVEAEPPAGDGLGPAAALFGCFAVHFESSRARA